MSSFNRFMAGISHTITTTTNKLPALLFTALFALSLSGCSSIPLSTMAKFVGFDKEDAFAIKPEELRVKASINSSIGLDLAQATNITMTFNTEQGEINLNLVLEGYKVETTAAEKGLFSTTPAFTHQYMKLTEQSISDFNRTLQLLQSGVGQKNTHKNRFSAGLNDKGQKINKTDENIYFSVAIKLSEADDFATLLDQYEIEQNDD